MVAAAEGVAGVGSVSVGSAVGEERVTPLVAY